MAIKDFIYSEVSSPLRDALEQRRSLIGYDRATSTALGYNIKKTVYARIHKLKRPIGDSASDILNRYTRDRFDSGDIQKTLTINVDGFKQEYTPDNRYLPKTPAITSIKISNKSRLGSIREAEIRISTPSLEQFNAFKKTYLEFGNYLAIEFGWSVPASNLDKDQLVGVIYNYSFALRSDPGGGFDIVIKTVGPGSMIPNTTMGQDPDETYNADLGNTKTVPLTDPFSIMMADIRTITNNIIKAIITKKITIPPPNQSVVITTEDSLITSVQVRFRSKVFNAPTQTGGFNFAYPYYFVIEKFNYGSESVSAEVPVLFKSSMSNATVNRVIEDNEFGDDPLKTFFGLEMEYLSSFISLGTLINIINNEYISEPGEDVPYEYISVGESVSNYVEDMFSADPINIIFPDERNANYSLSPGDAQNIFNIAIEEDVVDYVFEESPEKGFKYKPFWRDLLDKAVSDDPNLINVDEKEVTINNFLLGSRNLNFNNKFRRTDNDAVVNLKDIFISLELIDSIYDRNVNKEGYNRKNKVVDFLQDLFKRIYDASGTSYSLALREDQTIRENDDRKRFIIYDSHCMHYIKNDRFTEYNEPYEIRTHVKDSIVTSISLTSDITSRIAADNYTQLLGNGRGPGLPDQEEIEENDTEGKYIASTYEDVRQMFLSGIPPKKIILVTQEPKEINVSINQLRLAAFVILNNQFVLNTNRDTDQVIEAISRQSNVQITNMSSVVSMIVEKCIEKYVHLISQDSTNSQIRIPGPSLIPLNLSFTIDGIKGGGYDSDGWRYGNVITVNWLPENYKKYADFIVTSIDHNISPNNWTTSIQSVANFNFNKYLQDIEIKRVFGNDADPDLLLGEFNPQQHNIATDNTFHTTGGDNLTKYVALTKAKDNANRDARIALKKRRLFKPV